MFYYHYLDIMNINQNISAHTVDNYLCIKWQ